MELAEKTCLPFCQKTIHRNEKGLQSKNMKNKVEFQNNSAITEIIDRKYVSQLKKNIIHDLLFILKLSSISTCTFIFRGTVELLKSTSLCHNLLRECIH